MLSAEAASASSNHRPGTIVVDGILETNSSRCGVVLGETLRVVTVCDGDPSG